MIPRLHRVAPLLLAALAGITQSTRADSVVVFNEIMYHPATNEAALEWLELHNQNAVDVDLSGWKLANAIDFTFPDGTTIKGRGYLVVAASPDTLTHSTGITNVVGPFSGRLSNNGESIQLLDINHRVMDRLTYGVDGVWPPGPDGSGASLAKRDANLATRSPENWSTSEQLGGTPGTTNFPTTPIAPPNPRIVFNEIAPAGTTSFWIEIFNAGSVPVALQSLEVSRGGTQSATLPTQTLEPGGILALTREQLGFGTANGDKLFLRRKTDQGLLDAITVKPFPRARHPDGLGDWFTPSQPTPGTANLVQLRRDVVINEFLWHAPPIDETPTNTYQPSDEQWIELFNRSANPVDLTGWRLDAGIDFRFTNGPVLAPNGYLVIARDAAALRDKWPELGTLVLGDFTGKLRKGERFVLRDSLGNPVDETRVFEKDWSDGGGSSLERRDVDNDSLNPDSWADSDESAKGKWHAVKYRMVANQRYGSTRWREFRVGLLEKGMVLLDDFSVVRDPDGAREELIQNGTFDTTTGNTHWRFLGHHRGQFVADPDAPANTVLRLTTEDRAVMNHNHVETTFVNNTPLTNNVEYEVSFRARWLAGSPQVNTRAYFSKLAKTTILSTPTRLGTPGGPNSRRTPNAGPTFTGLRHSPVMPAPDEPVTISVQARDAQGVSAATLFYRVNPSIEFTNVPMALGSDATWSATLPGLPAGRIVHFYVRATDTLGASEYAPQLGPNSRALYQVQDAQVTKLPAHELRLIMLDADRNFMLANTNVMSNARNPGTLIYDRTEVFYDAGAKLQGTVASRIRDGDQYVSYDIDFPEDHLFRGVQNNIGIDRSGRGPTVRAQDEIYILHMFHRAGIPVPYSDLCYFIAPRTIHTGTAILQLAGYGAGFVDDQYGKSGTVFNMDITYEPDTSTGGIEGTKLPVPHQAHIGTDFTDLGDKEQYRSPFDIRLANRRDDYSGLMRLCQVMGSPQAEFDAKIGTVLDVDEALRMAAMEILCGIADTYISSTAGQLPHNLRLITFPDGSPAQLLPWDMDFVFSAAPNSPIPITTGSNLGKLMKRPATRRQYLAHVNDICQTAFTTNYMRPWLTHYASVVGQNFNAAAGYIASRHNYALTQLPPKAPFVITSNDGNDFQVETNLVTLTGTGWIDVGIIEVNGIPRPLDWSTLTNWSLTLPLMSGENALSLVAIDRQGKPLANQTDSIRITSTTPATRLPVVINEWMANNTSPGGYASPIDGSFPDWFELYNPNPTPVNLSGFFLTDDLANPAKFPIPTNTTIAPHGFLLVWADENIGSNSPEHPERLHANFKLSNNGESLGLFAPDGITAEHVVTFGPRSGNESEGLFPDGAVANRVVMADWSPGTANRTELPRAPIFTTSAASNGLVHATFESLPGRTYQMEYTNDLDAAEWRPLGTPTRASTTSLNLDLELGADQARFLRIRLL